MAPARGESRVTPAMAKAHPDTLRREFTAGHTIATHTLSHANLQKLSFDLGAAQIHLVLAWSYVVDQDGGRCPDALDSAAVEHDDVSVRVKVDAGREAGDLEGAGRPGGVVAITGEDCKREQKGAESVSRAAGGHR